MSKILVTGGAGFIGSNIVEKLLQMEQVSTVRVIDNLSNGFKKNLDEFMEHPKFEYVWGDIRDYNTCEQACQGMNLVCHQAALGSVPRSINDPVTSNNVNITGTLNIFTAAKNTGLNRVVYAASSSTYGDSKTLPKVEENIGNPLSPYAVTKLVNELYAQVYADLYEINFIGLRYFNVFGPKQDPNGAYAAVIPLFMKAILNNTPPTINGDGLQSRDFTYIDNAVQANIKALFTDNEEALNQVYNVAVGDRVTLLDLYNNLAKIAQTDLKPNFGPPRPGDVRHSQADISKAKRLLNYDPKIKVEKGLELAYEWYKDQMTNSH